MSEPAIDIPEAWQQIDVKDLRGTILRILKTWTPSGWGPWPSTRKLIRNGACACLAEGEVPGRETSRRFIIKLK